MKKKAASSKKKTASSKKKTKNSTGSPAVHTRESAAGKLEVQDAPVGIRAEGMPKFDPNAPTADEIQTVAEQESSGCAQSLVARGLELIKEGSLEDQGTEVSDQDTEVSDQDTEVSIDEKIKAEKLRELIEKKPETAAISTVQSKISVPKKIEILSCEMGYGVFATAQIDDGDIIEEAPIHIIPIRTKDGQEDPKIRTLLPLVMPLHCECKECIELGRRLVLSSGYIQIYNHSVEPNARILQHKANKRIYVIEALKSINHGEQIFINYGPNYPEQWLRPPGIMKNDEK